MVNHFNTINLFFGGHQRHLGIKQAAKHGHFAGYNEQK